MSVTCWANISWHVANNQSYTTTRAQFSANKKTTSICNQIYNKLCARLITFPIFVVSHHLLARNVAELFSSNRVVL